MALLCVVEYSRALRGISSLFPSQAQGFRCLILNFSWKIQVEWGHTWEELTEPPQPNPNGLYIPLRSNKKVLGLFTSSESGKLVAIPSQEKCEVKENT